MVTNQKLANTLKKFYEGKEFSTSFQDEVYSNWNDNDYETRIEEWEIVYYLKLTQLVGDVTNSIASFDVIITDIIIDDDHNRLDVWQDRGYDQYAWFIETVREDLYDTIGNSFPISLYFDFYTNEEYQNMDNQEEI